MTKEKLIDIFKSDSFVSDKLDGFFESNVCIPKGANRHPYADVLHQWIEGATLQYKLDSGWVDYREFSMPNQEHRIKPSEPVWEYRVAMYFADGTQEYTHKYFTMEEYREFGFPASCLLKEETKRERK